MDKDLRPTSYLLLTRYVSPIACFIFTTILGSKEVVLSWNLYKSGMIVVIGVDVESGLEHKAKRFYGGLLPHEVAPARTSSKTKNEKDKMIVLNDKNTFFADIEVVQRTMVALYGITKEGMWWNSWKVFMSSSILYVKFGKVETDLGGDFTFAEVGEAKILHLKKFERVSITLMNHALDPKVI